MRNDKFTGKHCSRGYCCSIISSESHVRYLYLSKMHGLPDSHFSTRCCRPSMSFSQLYHLASLHASILPVLSARKNLSRVTSLILIIPTYIFLLTIQQGNLLLPWYFHISQWTPWQFSKPTAADHQTEA